MHTLNRLKRRPLLVGTVLVGIAVLAAVLLSSHAHSPVARAVAAAPPRQDPDVLRFAPGAEQLSAIGVTRTAVADLPLTDALSARLAYDDDLTARIGVGISGRIVAIAVAPGDRVKAGQVLAEIDTPDLGTAAADLNKARADEHRKQLTAERAKELVPGDAIAQKDFESIEADLALAQAETVRAAQRLKNLNPSGLALAGQRLKLVSPVAGVVTERNVTPGLEVSPGLAAPLFVVSDPGHLWVLIDLPEPLLKSVQVGGKVAVESDAYPGEQFSAKIASLGQVVDPNTRRVTVRAVLDNPAHKLLPEMYTRARLLTAAGSGIAVPNGAIVNRGRYAYVFVQVGPQDYMRRQVTLATQGGDVSYVSKGLNGGENIVTTGALLLDAELTARADAQP